MVPAQLPKFSGCFLKEKDISTIKDEVGQCILVTHLISLIKIHGFGVLQWVLFLTIYSTNRQDVGREGFGGRSFWCAKKAQLPWCTSKVDPFRLELELGIVFIYWQKWKMQFRIFLNWSIWFDILESSNSSVWGGVSWKCRHRGEDVRFKLQRQGNFPTYCLFYCSVISVY